MHANYQWVVCVYCDFQIPALILLIFCFWCVQCNRFNMMFVVCLRPSYGLSSMPRTSASLGMRVSGFGSGTTGLSFPATSLTHAQPVVASR